MVLGNKLLSKTITRNLIVGFAFAILVGCSSNQKNYENKAIVGIWQNSSNPDASIEFTSNGDYYLRMNGERLFDNDSTIEKYSYDPISNGNNLIIYGNPKVGATQAKLMIINAGQIKISLFNQGTVVSEAEFTKVEEIRSP